MRKVLFWLLFLLVLGAAGTNAQVRIGGDEVPNEAAVLDLNADNENDGIKGLALPRVSLASTDDKMGYSDLLEGMLVYNTNVSMMDGAGVGVYYWDGNEWVKPAGGGVYEGSTSIVLSGDSLQRAALTGDVTAATNSNATTISDGAVSRQKTTILSGMLVIYDVPGAVGSTGITAPPAGCDWYNTSFNWNYGDTNVCSWSGAAQIACTRFLPAVPRAMTVFYVCFP